MYTLYPSIKSFATHKINVASPHVLHVEECGNPNGVPVLIIHSGPGTGCEPFHRRFFCPETYRIILFDQRGAGQSTPHACITENTTADLIDDIELIRDKLKIDRWFLFGTAWGSTLALLYAEEYSQHVSGLILNCVFLARKKDIKWFYQEGTNAIFPEHWQDFIAPIPEEERKDLVKAYAKRLSGNDELARMSAAKAWSLWQAQCLSLHPHHNTIEHFTDPHFATGLAKIESHYFSNDCFIEDNKILNNIGKIRHLPIFLIHGRYDVVCPLENAWLIHDACPSSELIVVRDAGHSLNEAGIIDAIVLASKNILTVEPPPAC
jgi:proline iminopeptidase